MCENSDPTKHKVSLICPLKQGPQRGGAILDHRTMVPPQGVFLCGVPFNPQGFLPQDMPEWEQACASFFLVQSLLFHGLSFLVDFSKKAETGTTGGSLGKRICTLSFRLSVLLEVGGRSQIHLTGKYWGKYEVLFFKSKNRTWRDLRLRAFSSGTLILVPCLLFGG